MGFNYAKEMGNPELPLTHLENRISEDIDTLLTGPLGERGKRQRRMRQDHL